MPLIEECSQAFLMIRVAILVHTSALGLFAQIQLAGVAVVGYPTSPLWGEHGHTEACSRLGVAVLLDRCEVDAGQAGPKREKPYILHGVEA